jgi:peptidoglycan/xylan/chitin deacetylase (PgdA/CDA1 family)
VLKKVPDHEKDDALLEIASSLGVNVPELPPDDYGGISWDQARRMEADGVEIGSHTKTHPILTSVSDSRLLSELAESRARLEAMLGHEINLLCYPNGNHDGQVRRAAVASGYLCAVTVELGFNDHSIDPMRLRRMDAEADFMRFIQITSGFDQIKNRFRRTHRKAG